MGFVNSVGKIFTVINKEDTSGWHNYWQWRPETSSDTTSSEVPKDENSGIPDVELAKGDWSNFAYDREMIRDTVLIPNGLNTWNEERYEMTGYINNINTANTQVLMEFHDKGYAGNIYEYGVKRESVSHWQNTNYYAYDGRGSVSDPVDPNGDVQMYHSYEPDGQTTLRFRGYIKNPYRYNAERVDYVPGIADFQYLRARYYAPNLGRFIQQDIVWGTIQTPLSQNLFIYCQNNAVNFTDPSGLYPKEAEDYYRQKIDEALKNYTALEGYVNKVSSQMDKMYMQSQMRMYEEKITSYEQTLTKMTGNLVSDSIAKAKGESERESCEYFVFEKVLIPETTVGGRKYSAQNLDLSRELQGLIAELAKISGVDYYLILATIAHESSSIERANENYPNRAAGYMQLVGGTWVNYGKPGGAYYEEYSELREWAIKNGADFNDKYDGLTNITVGVSHYAEWMTYSFGDDMKQVVGHYGEGSKTNFETMVSSTTEILYYRDVLAKQGDEKTWYFGDLYTDDGKQLVTNFDPTGNSGKGKYYYK